MTSAQARLADTIEKFYSAADRTSDGAMAGHAFKSAIEELDNSVQRELVRRDIGPRGDPHSVVVPGRALSYVYHGATGKDECVLSGRQRAYHQA